MRFLSRSALLLTLTAGLAFTTGCHPIGRVGDPHGDIYGGGRTREVAGEIKDINKRGREIEVRTEDRRVREVSYDNKTRVVYRQRDYGVNDLEVGDYVAIRVQYDSDTAKPYAELIRVQQSAQERGTNSRTRLEKLDGTIEFVDTRRGIFELNDGGRRRVTVVMPYNPARRDQDRFRRLREGDHVQLEGRFVNSDRFELEAFL